MQDSKGRNVFTGTLVFVAVVFGMVLSGGLHLTPIATATPDTSFQGRAVTVPPSAVGGLPSFADLAAAVSPAVVSVQATKIEAASDRPGRDPFELFFPRRRQEPQLRRPPQEQRSDSAGSGFLIGADGLVVTNHHVIDGATDLTVLVAGREYKAEVKGDDPATDIALLQVKTDEPFTYLELGDSESLRVGDWVMVIGSPLQLQNSVSVGVVSAKTRSINITPDPSLENFIQTDAAINFGNSGGPLVDLQGRVVGIATAINFGAENIGFAVPVSTLRRILPQLQESGSVRRGYLGVTIADLDFDRARAWGLESASGVLVNEVTDDGPAKEAGIEHGDIILQVDEHEVGTNRDLIDYVASLQPGTSVDLKVFRDGKTIDKRIKLGERPPLDGAVVPQETEEESSIEWLGLQYQDLTPGLKESHGMPEDLAGVFVTEVAPSSPLFEEGVEPGDVIVEVNRVRVSGVDEFERRIESAEPGTYLRFYVEQLSRDRAFYAIVKVP
jgi:serine protease Do